MACASVLLSKSPARPGLSNYRPTHISHIVTFAANRRSAPLKDSAGSEESCQWVSNTDGGQMIQKVVRKHNLKERDSTKHDLAYWLTKGPAERVATVELLRRQYHGSSSRLQKSARVIQQTRG
jgi:hypothetical protein